MSKKKHAKKKDDGCPAFVHDDKPTYSMKLELEKALAHRAVAKKIKVGSAEWKQITLQDLLGSLKLQDKRWGPLEKRMINTTTQRCMQLLSQHLARLRHDMVKMLDLVAAEEDRLRDLKKQQLRGKTTDGAEDQDDDSSDPNRTDTEDGEQRPIGDDGEEIKQGDAA